MTKYFSFAYIKQHPVMFGVIVIVFGLLVYLLLNRGGGSGSGSGEGGVVYQQAGSDPAALAAQTQLGMASIAANAQIQSGQLQIAGLAQQGKNDLAIASIQAQIEAAALGANERLGSKSIDANLEAMRLDAITARDMQRDALGFQLGYQQSQNQMTIELSKQQAEAFKTATLISAIPSLKKKNRDEALTQIAGYAYGQMIPNAPMLPASNPVSFLPPSSIN